MNPDMTQWRTLHNRGQKLHLKNSLWFELTQNLQTLAVKVKVAFFLHICINAKQTSMLDEDVQFNCIISSLSSGPCSTK